MNDNAAGPIVLWENYGCEGWKPRSFATLTEALVAQRFNSEFVVTKIVDVEVVEKSSDTYKITYLGNCGVPHHSHDQWRECVACNTPRTLQRDRG